MLQKITSYMLCMSLISMCVKQKCPFLPKIWYSGVFKTFFLRVSHDFEWFFATRIRIQKPKIIFWRFDIKPLNYCFAFKKKTSKTPYYLITILCKTRYSTSKGARRGGEDRWPPPLKNAKFVLQYLFDTP